MKKLIDKYAVIVGIIFTAFIVFSVAYVWQNERYDVEFFSGSKHQYYENTPDAAQINVSPALAWDHVSAGAKIIGWVLLAAMWLAIWYVATDRHLGKKKPNEAGDQRNGLAVVLIAIPLVLCAASFFGGYSSKYSSNSVVIERQRFNSWLSTGAIEKKGEKTYIDKSDSIKMLFDKPFIQ